MYVLTFFLSFVLSFYVLFFLVWSIRYLVCAIVWFVVKFLHSSVHFVGVFDHGLEGKGALLLVFFLCALESAPRKWVQPCAAAPGEAPGGRGL